MYWFRTAVRMIRAIAPQKTVRTMNWPRSNASVGVSAAAQHSGVPRTTTTIAARNNHFC